MRITQEVGNSGRLGRQVRVMREKGSRKPMVKGILLGIILGVIGVAAGVYLYFANGHAPVGVTAADMPFERTCARLGLHAYLGKLPHPEPGVAADEKNLLEGAKVYKDNF